MLNIYKSLNENCIFLWDDNIPIERILDEGIEKNINFSLKNKIKITDIFPVAFSLDDNNIISFHTGDNFDSIYLKLIEEFKDKNFSKEAYEYIIKDYYKSGDQIFDNKKNTVIIYRDNNSLCIEDEYKIQADNLFSDFNIIKIYDFDSIEIDDNIYIDYLGVYNDAFAFKNIKPSYSLVNKEGESNIYYNIDDLIKILNKG